MIRVFDSSLQQLKHASLLLHTCVLTFELEVRIDTVSSLCSPLIFLHTSLTLHHPMGLDRSRQQTDRSPARPSHQHTELISNLLHAAAVTPRTPIFLFVFSIKNANYIDVLDFFFFTHYIHAMPSLEGSCRYLDWDRTVQICVRRIRIKLSRQVLVGVESE